MPFKSKKQMDYMHKKMPELAKKWSKESEAKDLMGNYKNYNKKKSIKNLMK